MDSITIIRSALDEHRQNVGGYVALVDFVSAPKGIRQPSGIPGVETEWVDQRGDEAGGFPYHGEFYIQVSEDLWAKFEFTA